MTNATKVVAFGRAKSEKPANKTVSQNNNTAKKGIGIELPKCENRRNRACAVSWVT
jgi:hypothetical protein